MAKATIYNMEGKVLGERELNPKIFEVKPRKGLLHLASVIQAANGRQVLAHTKTRAEVRGGGKKPWKQKGTGRARHGSTRSPIWIGGGVTFGPRKDRNFEAKINKKAKRKALFMGLSDKAANGKIMLLDVLQMEKPETKRVALLLKKLGAVSSVMIVLPKGDEAIVRSVRNMKNASTIGAESLNVRDVLQSGALLMPVASLEKIESVFLK